MSAPNLSIETVDFNVLPMETRFPFKYGIAAMTKLPHLFVTIRGHADNESFIGVASEGLPPKWFTKNPDTTFEQDLPLILEVIQHAGNLLKSADAASFFGIWQQLYDGQAIWAKERGLPPLLTNLGVSLMERAVIDGLCRQRDICFGDSLRSNILDIDLGCIHALLSGYQPADLLPTESLTRITARHTIGLGDPLELAEVKEPLNDGLPYALDECIEAYGLNYFKVKLCGKLEQDLERLASIHNVLSRCAPSDYRITLDGNEQFLDIGAFASHWNRYLEDEKIRALFDHLLFVEQPIHRDHALDDTVRTAIDDWPAAPPLIIDESEAEIESLPRALKLGYRGTSHKNCKGIVKGIANACLLEKMRRDSSEEYYLSGEDLANVGPVALLQDLAVMAALGITHVERNGHHYFQGLSMFPREVQDRILADHPDLYRNHESGFPTLDIQKGELALGSVVTAPFGCRPRLATEAFSVARM